MSDLTTAYLPSIDRHVTFGRRRPDAFPVPLRAHPAFAASVPTPPRALDWSPWADAILADVMANDRLGDCTCAAGAHVLGVWTANAGSPFHATKAQVLADYSAVSGYDPRTGANDNGASEIDCFHYWERHGFPNGSTLAGYLSVDAGSPLLLKQVVYLNLCVYLTLELPDSFLAVRGGNFTWPVAGPPNPRNGHAIMAYGYSDAGLLIDTWGLKGTITWPALARYCVPSAGGSAYALACDAQVAGGGVCPNGLPWSSVVGFDNALGFGLPMPPVPTPVPTPAPTPAPASGRIVIDLAARSVTVPNDFSVTMGGS